MMLLVKLGAIIALGAVTGIVIAAIAVLYGSENFEKRLVN